MDVNDIMLLLDVLFLQRKPPSKKPKKTKQKSPNRVEIRFRLSNVPTDK